MKKKKLPVKWDPLAKAILDDFCEMVKKDSGRSVARRVRSRFINLAKILSVFPQKFPKEELLDELDGDFRSVPIWSFKMIYEVTDHEIIIAYLFHTSKHPDRLLKEVRDNLRVD